jgi:hypothetical protein
MRGTPPKPHAADQHDGIRVQEALNDGALTIPGCSPASSRGALRRRPGIRYRYTPI